MIKSKLFFVLTVFVFLAFLSACNNSNVNKYELNVTSNLEDVSIDSKSELNDGGVSFYKVTAPIVEGYTFLYWNDITDLNDILELSSEQSYSFIPASDMSIKAVYQDSSILHVVTVRSMIDGADPQIDRAGNVIFIEANEVSRYTFLYWVDDIKMEIISNELIYSFTADSEMVCEAIYEEISVSDDYSDYLLMDLDSYYDNAEGLYGVDLMAALHTIINTGFIGVTYGEARYILDESDVDPNTNDNLILVYLGTSISNKWDSGSTWNREHVWPQSLLGSSANNGEVNVASDLYNLMPSNPAENSARSNYPFTALLNGYEPPDERKGDVARALFYMMIMYDELNLVNTAPKLHEMGYLDELIAWSLSDPVDDFELNRLDVIYSYQLNRNPFVDYPHFVELIWFEE